MTHNTAALIYLQKADNHIDQLQIFEIVENMQVPRGVMGFEV